MLALAILPVALAALGSGPAGRAPFTLAQDTTHHDTAAGAVVTDKPKHSVAYNIGHSTKKAMKDTKNAVGKGAKDTGHEMQRAAKNTKNEVHRDANRVSRATKPSAAEAARDSARRARVDSTP